MTIALGDVGEVAGRLIDENGKPIAGCDIVVDSLDRSPGKPGVVSTRFGCPHPVAKSCSARTDADGRFVIGGIPTGATIQADLRAPGLGEPRVAWISTAPVTITLDRRLGAIKGSTQAARRRGAWRGRSS